MEAFQFTDVVLKNFQTWRGWLVEALEKVDEDIVDTIPAGCNNSIHWHAGHIAVAWDRGIFQNVFKEKRLPDHYEGYFTMNTSPANWSGEAPSLAEIIDCLQEQRQSICERMQGNWNRDLVHPFFENTKASQMFLFLLSHEAMHFGQIRTYIHIAQAS
ncbi:DinB family protein [Paenibacillus alvei]|uniref:DinB family protein n=2 Tax=Paenibacillus TaxID=44249 RepID=A0ABT4H194_PAEAL|nr:MULTISPECIES: DinB family protein [Paenibacillus]EJW15477.1 hypothetical protein PAV_8c01440 [Paenibacillus alvei DSM 29]MCY9542472.1 DinB family protein [Paenibacillus alvei]MCY9706639.1 DinB family protein [Paenibacillus alvei]MCY9736609.1 DinB family protein [Paenibacillus alvei]MCY9757955.1 DinB family protein [Paenibacillus alvei]